MSWIDALRERMINRFAADRRDAELDEEIRHHLEIETERLRRRGHDRAIARKLALERLGDPDWIKRATRDERATTPIVSLAGASQDVRWAIRSLARQPGFTTLSLITLAVGIGAATAGFTVLDHVLLRPLPYAQSE